MRDRGAREANVVPRPLGGPREAGRPTSSSNGRGHRPKANTIVPRTRLAILAGDADIARLLLEAGADPHIRDGRHDSDARGWAEFFERQDIVQMLDRHGAKT